MTVRWTTVAQRDLGHIIAYIEQDSLKLPSKSQKQSARVAICWQTSRKWAASVEDPELANLFWFRCHTWLSTESHRNL